MQKNGRNRNLLTDINGRWTAQNPSHSKKKKEKPT